MFLMTNQTNSRYIHEVDYKFFSEASDLLLCTRDSVRSLISCSELGYHNKSGTKRTLRLYAKSQ